METMALDTTTLTAGDKVKAKTICLVLRIGRFGNTKQASLAGAQLSPGDPAMEPDKTLLTLNKTLLRSPELWAVNTFDSKLAARIRKLAFQSMLKGGMYLIPIAQVETAEQIIAEAIPERRKLVDKAVEAYPLRVAETCAKLGSAANPTDYPSVAQYRATFVLEHSYLDFDTPTRLKAINAALWQAEVRKESARLRSVAQECQQAMRAGLLKLVNHLADRLTPEPDGTQKRLHQTTITNLTEYLAIFDLRNVTDDDMLGDVVKRAREVMAGIDHDVLKSDDAVRERVIHDLTAMSALLDPLVIDKARQITFEDE